MKILLVLLSLSVFVSCGEASKVWPTNEDKTVYKIEPAQAEAFSYELRSKSCSTGKHSFGTFENACEALIDEALNNQCAVEKREELFINSECPGHFTSV